MPLAARAFDSLPVVPEMPYMHNFSEENSPHLQFFGLETSYIEGSELPDIIRPFLLGDEEGVPVDRVKKEVRVREKYGIDLEDKDGQMYMHKMQRMVVSVGCSTLYPDEDAVSLTEARKDSTLNILYTYARTIPNTTRTALYIGESIQSFKSRYPSAAQASSGLRKLLGIHPGFTRDELTGRNPENAPLFYTDDKHVIGLNLWKCDVPVDKHDEALARMLCTSMPGDFCLVNSRGVSDVAELAGCDCTADDTKALLVADVKPQPKEDVVIRV